MGSIQTAVTMEEFRDWFKKETDTLKNSYCTQVDNYFERILREMEPIIGPPGNASTEQLSMAIQEIVKLKLHYQQVLDWLSRRYFAAKPTFPTVFGTIHVQVDVPKSSPVSTFAEYLKLYLQQPGTTFGEKSNGTQATLSPPPSEQQSMSVGQSDLLNNIPNMNTNMGSSVNVESQFPCVPGHEFHPDNGEVQMKKEDITARPRENDSPNPAENTVNVSTFELYQADSDDDSNCDCEECQAEKMGVQAEDESTVVVPTESDNSAAPPNGSNVSIKRECDFECDFNIEREFDFNFDQLNSDEEGDKVESSAAGQVNESKDAKLVHVPAHAQLPQGPAPVATTALKRKLSTSGPSSAGTSMFAAPDCNFKPTSPLAAQIPGTEFSSATDNQLDYQAQFVPIVFPLSIPRHICSTCRRNFITETFLQIHQLTHGHLES